MKAFATGSRVYGNPTRDSDIDLVVLTNAETVEALAELADKDMSAELAPRTTGSDPGPADEPDGVTASLKFGKLNLICVTGMIGYAVWLRGTKELAKRATDTGKPVSRDDAVAHFRALRERFGLRKKPE